MPFTDFDNAVAVITGGASGIGLATATELHKRGTRVVLADINSPGLQEAKQSLSASSSELAERVLEVTTDVTNADQVQTLMQRAHEAFGRLDLVVTCAGIGRGGPIDLYPPQEMQTILNINVMGTYNSVYCALPFMRQRQTGQFVFLSSVAGKLPVPLLSAYCTSKWAIRGLASALRAEFFGSGIDITTVYPAWVDTPMIKQEESTLQLMAIEALLTPAQVANEILDAIVRGEHDLTLAPNPEIAAALELAKIDIDQLEQVMGMSFQQRLSQLGQSEPALKSDQ